MIFRIRLDANGDVINFVEDDDGDHIDQIENAVGEVLSLERTQSVGSGLEEYRQLNGDLGTFIIRWDGYMLDLLALDARISMAEVFARLEASDSFSL